MANEQDLKLRAEEPGPGKVSYIRSVGEFCPGILGMAQQGDRFKWMIRWDNKHEEGQEKMVVDVPMGKVRVKKHMEDPGSQGGEFFEAEEIVAACMDDDTAIGIWMCLMGVLAERAGDSAQTGNSACFRDMLPLIDETEEALVEHGYIARD